MEKGNLIIGQSGGPTSVINSSLYGAIVEAKKHDEIDKVYGMLYGITGLINDQIIDLSDYSIDELELLKQTPSSILGSCRYKLTGSHNSGDYQGIKKTLTKYNIKYILYLGGNDSMDTVMKLTKFFNDTKIDCRVLGIPKTIDNDLISTDNAPGYGSAAKFIANAVSAIKADTSVYDKGRVTIVEVMGRDSGWLTAASKLASLNGSGPDLIYLPEVPFSKAKFLNDVVHAYGKNRKTLICVSEGLKNKDGEYLSIEHKNDRNNDAFGHNQLGKTAEYLAKITANELSVPVRSIEINLLQRCFSNVSSLYDINEAVLVSEYGVKKIIDGETGSMVTVIRDNGVVSCSLTKIESIANKIKEFPKEWIVDGHDVSDSFIKYAKPLIEGEYQIKYENGVIKYFKLHS